MIANKVERMHHFQQGLRLDIQNYMVTSHLETYAEVIDVARSVEQVINKESDVQAYKPERTISKVLGDTSNILKKH